MNYFKILLCTLLAIPSASFAMQEPAKTFTFTDAQDQEYTIANPEDYQALVRCESLKGFLDLKMGNPHLSESYLIGANIKTLIEYIKNPKIIGEQSKEQNIIMLQVATYCHAPENVLFELANLVWMELQDNTNDSGAVKHEKNKLRGIAEPYLHSPDYLSRFISAIKNNSNANLSHTRLLKLEQWQEDKDGSLYNVHHKLVTLNGLGDFINISDDSRCNQLNLSGHSLQHDCLKDIINNIRPRVLDVSNNQISTLDLSEIDIDNLPQLINLKNNKIKELDEKFFEWLKEIRYSRKLRKDLIINLENNLFTEQQKKEYEKRIYKINYSLPERVNWNLIKKCVAYPLYATLPLSFAYTLGKLESDYSLIEEKHVGAASLIGGFLGLHLANHCKNIIHDDRDYDISTLELAIMGISSFVFGFKAIHERLLENFNPASLAGKFNCKAISLATASSATTAICWFLCFPHKIRNKLRDTIAIKLSKKTHPTLKASSFVELESAKRVTVKF